MNVNTNNTEYPTCPNCGFKGMDIDDVVLINSGKCKCKECGKYFRWVSEITVMFSTEKIDWLDEWEMYNSIAVQIGEIND